jgi:4'-phosphopantetheinyl transferase
MDALSHSHLHGLIVWSPGIPGDRFHGRDNDDLETGEIDLVAVRLCASRIVLEAAAQTLSADELSRAARYRTSELQERFLLARACLRRLLADATGLAPAEIRFAYLEAGKPVLDGGPGSKIWFNLSHCRDMALYGVSRTHKTLGVDIEQRNPQRELQDIATHFFSREECAEWQQYPVAERVAAFYRCWVRKESYIKAVGDGLQIPLDSFQVSLDSPARLIRAHRGDASLWHMEGFRVADDFEAALVYHGEYTVVKPPRVWTAEELLV